jgi:hypothetical protein
MVSSDIKFVMYIVRTRTCIQQCNDYFYILDIYLQRTPCLASRRPTPVCNPSMISTTHILCFFSRYPPIKSLLLLLWSHPCLDSSGARKPLWHRGGFANGALVHAVPHGCCCLHLRPPPLFQTYLNSFFSWGVKGFDFVHRVDIRR